MFKAASQFTPFTTSKKLLKHTFTQQSGTHPPTSMEYCSAHFIKIFDVHVATYVTVKESQ
jgi:hypothetical protein